MLQCGTSGLRPQGYINVKLLSACYALLAFWGFVVLHPFFIDASTLACVFAFEAQSGLILMFQSIRYSGQTKPRGVERLWAVGTQAQMRDSSSVRARMRGPVTTGGEVVLK